MSRFSKRTIKVMGEPVVFDTDELNIKNLSKEMERVASQLAWWGAVWAGAAHEHAEMDAYYRAWRAKKVEEIVTQDPKLPEWKVKAKVEAHQDFLAHKKAVAVAEEQAILARNTHAAFQFKSNQLQSKGAVTRAELKATGMSTPETDPDDLDDTEVDVRTETASTSFDEKLAAIKARKAMKKGQ